MNGTAIGFWLFFMQAIATRSLMSREIKCMFFSCLGRLQ